MEYLRRNWIDFETPQNAITIKKDRMSSNIEFVNTELNGGFLSGFVEASVEKPVDGRNGECIVHYADQQGKYEMTVPLVNGMREGIGTILKKGAPFIQVEYHRGFASGTVCRMDDYGVVEMRGQLLNGMESGLFEEYDRSDKVVWRGYYRNGKRYSEVVKSEQLEGYYDEKSAENGRLLSIAQYDKDLHDKNGRCLEYENGSLRSECEYENGVKKHTSRQFVNERMTMFDSNGKKVYEGKWFGDMKSGFLCHEKMEGMSGYFKEEDSSGQLISVSEYDELNVFKNGKCFEMENGKVKRVCVYENGVVKRVMQGFNESTMTEYNNGKRVYKGGWKGDMKNGFVREGKGKEYEKDGETALYSGQWKSGKRDGKGTEYRDGHALYTGEWKNGMRNGEGKEMDGNGRVMWSGKWANGKYKNTVMTPSSLTSNPLDIEELRTGNRRYNGGSVTELKLSGLARLKRIVIGDECFGKVRVFGLSGLGKLESVVIGSESFRISGNERNDGSCQIVNCPKLKSIQIGHWSFEDYHSFELNNLPSLHFIGIGVECFSYAPSFSLTGLIDGLV